MNRAPGEAPHVQVHVSALHPPSEGSIVTTPDCADAAASPPASKQWDWATLLLSRKISLFSEVS